MGYYGNPKVLSEMEKFLRGRRVMAVCGSEERIIEINDIPHLDEECRVYGSIELKEGIATPCIAIEFESGARRLAFEAVRLIQDFVSQYGLKRSSYVVWTGRWFEVRIHEYALPREFFLEISNPCEAAALVSEYIMVSLSSKLRKLSFVSGGKIRIVNAARYGKLIAPLSTVDRVNVAVYLVGKLIESFDPSYSSKSNPVHVEAWSSAIECEAHKLAEAVLEAYRKGKLKPGHHSEITSRGGVIPKIVGRFEVMALLQAARYYVLTGDLEKAKSFGLNRAIFYAWAKHYGPRRWRAITISEKAKESAPPARSIGIVKDEVETSLRGWFEIGGQEQTPQDFDRQIKFKFDTFIPFEVVWRIAVDYVKQFPESILRDPNKFFKYVYEPVRDSFVEKVVLGMDFAPSEEARRAHRECNKHTRSAIKAEPKQHSLTSFMKRSGISEDSYHH